MAGQQLDSSNNGNTKPIQDPEVVHSSKFSTTGYEPTFSSAVRGPSSWWYCVNHTRFES